MIEQDIEDALLEKLTDLKYVFREDIRDRAALERNFRHHFETLNQVRLTDAEFHRLLEEIVTPDVYTASKRLREQGHFEREDGTPLYYTLVNLTDWCKNHFEVIHQLRINTDYSHHRYDVILLINGVPVVQMELKTLSVSPRRAMEQIVQYKNDPGNGYGKTLLCFLQLFIVSNRTETLYFANNNPRHFAFNAEERFLPVYQYADRDNRKIGNLDEFTQKFLAKCTLGEMVSRYMVLVASEQKLMIMRPYQIYAVQAIVECIHRFCGNGYIWHTTGSGKTLTSFKASTLLKDNPDIDKCLFVVDRKDLDRQTREEFNRFQEGCVEENTHTGKLVERLLSEDYANKVIVTTIQKLGLALDGTHRRNYKERLEPLRQKRIVFIFDECHRSQFGDNHQAIKEFFPNAQLFGFTGTPIFEANASYQQIEGEQASYRTTSDIFQQQLHAYTITHAIEDQNVLRFHVDYFKPEGKVQAKPGEPIAKRAVVEAILAKHDAATAHRRFNALFATASIHDAIEYHALFQEYQAQRKAEDPDFRPLNIACVFSPPAEGNADVRQIQEDLPQERADNAHAPEEKKAALVRILADYNAQYGTHHDLSNFDLYYQDIQKRIKDQQYPDMDLPHAQKIDLTIVVDMLLTGFDSAYLNTLYVDKNLKYHGLIQAFSRTNRVLNDTKPYGNILDFRNQQAAVDTAIQLFSGESGAKAKEVWLVDKAPVVIEKLEKAKQELDGFLQSQGLTPTPGAVPNLQGDAARAQFINRFKQIQKLKTQLDQYTDLGQDDHYRIEAILPQDTVQEYRGVYLDTVRRLRDESGRKDQPPSPEAEQLDFELVLFASAIIDYDYIMGLIAKYSQQEPGKRTVNREELIGLIQSDAKFINDGQDIAAFIDTLEVGKGLDEKAIREGFERFKAEKQGHELDAIAEQNDLDPVSVKTLVDETLRRSIFDGERLSELFREKDLGWKARSEAESALMADLIPHLHKRAQGREIAGLKAYE
nr:type I restriction endonuclease subunit R [Acidithiobacillus montserratensis]MBU2747220.1 type I restriction endonuclease subunit R [Acidithiobacillus montserratensis]